MSSISDRKAEIELKKAKLRALREGKLKRDDNLLPGLSGSNSRSGSISDLRPDPDAILKNLGIPPLKESDASDRKQHTFPADHALVDGVSSRFSSDRRRKLNVSKVFEFDVQPHSFVSYPKETQTIEVESEPETEKHAMDYYVLTYDDTPTDNDQLFGSSLEENEHVDAKMLKSVHGEIPRKTGASTRDDIAEPALIALTEEQKQQMLLSDGFRHFFDRSSRIIERALCMPEEIFTDYSGEDAKLDANEDLLLYSREFFDEQHSKNRVVTGLDWSTTYPELLLAAYSPNEEVLYESAGCCLIWNMKFARKSSPEYILTCSEPITSAAMARFHPNLVIGGTYSGQLVLWDTRSPKRIPVQRSTLTSWAHTQPLNTVQVIGSQNAHNIITLSSDGALCVWSIEMLGQPREKVKVCETPSSGLFEVFPTCMAFFANDQNNFVVGSESGNIYTDQRHSSRSTSTDPSARHHPYKGHSALVTNVSTHPSPGATSFSHLFLSSSLDWSVRLWSVRDQTPLHVFDDYSECVYDVTWSPIHPAAFATADGMGRVDVWDLNADVEVPTARLQLPVNHGSSEPAAINKLRWDPTGLFLASGDDDGHVHICSVAESLATPSSEAWSNLTHVLANLKSTNQAF